MLDRIIETERQAATTDYEKKLKAIEARGAKMKQSVDLLLETIPSIRSIVESDDPNSCRVEVMNIWSHTVDGSLTETNSVVTLGSEKDKQIYFVSFSSTQLPNAKKGFTVKMCNNPMEHVSFWDVFEKPQGWTEVGVGTEEFANIVGLSLCGLAKELIPENGSTKNWKQCINLLEEQLQK